MNKGQLIKPLGAENVKSIHYSKNLKNLNEQGSINKARGAANVKSIN
jgi:hypothetical protein